MGSVAILCKLRNGNAYSGMEHWGVLQHTIHSKGGSGELHKGGGKGKLPTAFDFRDCRSGPQQKGSCKGDPRAKNKQCQCRCAASPEGAARRCRHKPRNRHECMKCHTLVGTGCCWIEHRQLCRLCREEQLFFTFVIFVPLQTWIWMPRLMRKVQRNSSKKDGTLSRGDKCDLEQ